MKTAPREASPGRPAELPLHRIVVRFEREPETLADYMAGTVYEERSAFAYSLGAHEGFHLFRLADEDGTPRPKVWAAEPDEIVSDVPAERQPERVPPAAERERVRFCEVRH